MRYFNFAFLGILLMFSASCQKSTDPVEENKPPPGYQEDIPWPSLADSPWPMAHHDPQNTGRSKLWGPTQGIISWEFDQAYKMYNSVVVGADSTAYIFIPPADGGLFALNPDGTLKWNLNILTTPYLFTAPIITADGTIFCYNGHKIVHAVDPTATIKYSFNLETITRTPTFTIDKEGNFYYVDENATLYVIDQEGNIQWMLQDERFNSYSSYLSFSPDGNTIYIVGSSPILSAVDINTKQIRWSFEGDDLPDVPSFRPANGSVVDSYGNIYFLTHRNFDEAELFAIKPDGDIKWRYKIHTPNIRINANIPTIDKLGNLYCATDSLYSFDFVGNLRWKSDLNNNISDCPLICDDNGLVYIGTMGTMGISLQCFDSDGNLLWKIDDNQNQVGGSPAIGFNEVVFFPTWSSNKLYGIK
jgi:outer membrane protein assembly factor BamB